MIFLTKLKIASLTYIKKKDDTTIMDNYRPVPHLPSISKVFEKVAFDQLYRYFQDNKPVWLSKRTLHRISNVRINRENFARYRCKKIPLAVFMDLKVKDSIPWTIAHKVEMLRKTWWWINVVLQFFNQSTTICRIGWNFVRPETAVYWGATRFNPWTPTFFFNLHEWHLTVWSTFQIYSLRWRHDFIYYCSVLFSYANEHKQRIV